MQIKILCCALRRKRNNQLYYSKQSATSVLKEVFVKLHPHLDINEKYLKELKKKHEKMKYNIIEMRKTLILVNDFK